MSAPTLTRTSTPSKATMLYAVRSWDEDGSDITVYTSLRAANWSAARSAMDFTEDADSALYRKMSTLTDPGEIIEMFEQSDVVSDGCGVEVTLTRIAS